MASRSLAGRSARIRPEGARTTRGQTLVGLLAALVIIAILAAVLVPKIAGRHHQPGQSGLTPQEDANQAACGIYEAQINQAIMMYRQDHDANPPNLDALKRYGVTDDMIHAPDCIYIYDPSTGVVSNGAEGALGRAGVVNPTGPEEYRSAPTAPAQAPPSGGPPPIVPPGSAPAGAERPGGGGDHTHLPGGLSIPNVGGGMGAGQ